MQGVGWGDVNYYYDNKTGQFIIDAPLATNWLMKDGKTPWIQLSEDDEDIILIGFRSDGVVVWKNKELFKNTSIYQTAIQEMSISDLIKLFKRCREFIKDNTEDLFGVVNSDLVYRIITREGFLKDNVDEDQKALAKAKRETKLREDIEKAIKILTGSNK